jgi:quercetin dioxygenase-like cupin family protein
MERIGMKRAAGVLAAIVLLAGAAVPTRADDTKPLPKLENLLKTELVGAPGTEVIVSRVEIPANTSLPKHWHPGEEFAYVLEGSVTLWQEGRADTVLVEGQTGMIPLKQVHTAKTGDRDVTLLVFRVHAKGQPERVPAP